MYDKICITCNALDFNPVDKSVVIFSVSGKCGLKLLVGNTTVEQMVYLFAD